LKINWSNIPPVKPTFTGTNAFTDYDPEEIADYIDWQPFFMPGNYMVNSRRY
jgi:5-methyltetrahydrofolate--homocysteine methyltransferase